jgi:hypothetical protein
MKHFMAGPIALFLVLGSTWLFPALARADLHMSLEPDSAVVQPGDTVTVRITVFRVGAADSSFNAFDAFIAYDPARLELVNTTAAARVGPVFTDSCGNFFHQFLPTPGQLEIHLSMLCPKKNVTGPGDLYRVRMRVLPGTGPTNLVWNTGLEFYRGGFFVRPVEALPMTLFVGSMAGVNPPGEDARRLAFETPWPNPHRGAGPATLKFSLAAPDRVGFEILDAQGRRVAVRTPDEFGAGAHTVNWTGLQLAPGCYLVKMNTGNNLQAARAWVIL